MRRIESVEDDLKGIVRYELANGQMVALDVFAVREYGLAKMLEVAGAADQVPTARVDVMQCGRKIGTVPGDFDPMFIKSKSPWYFVRRGDFTREGDVWTASRMLGPGDLEAVPGFRWAR